MRWLVTTRISYQGHHDAGRTPELTCKRFRATTHSAPRSYSLKLTLRKSQPTMMIEMTWRAHMLISSTRECHYMYRDTLLLFAFLELSKIAPIKL